MVIGVISLVVFWHLLIDREAISRLSIESQWEQRTVYIGTDCLRGTDSDESPT